MDRLGGYFGTHDTDEAFDDAAGEADVALDPPSPVGQDERRMQVRAYNHWASLLGDRVFPDVDDLEPHRLDDFGPFSVLLDLTDGIDDPRIAFVGSELFDECAYAGAMATLSAVPSRSVLSRITDHYMQIIANQAPIGFEAEFDDERGVTVLYRGILLPYSSDNATIDYIYGVINWKHMADQATADELLLEIDQALAADRSDDEDTYASADADWDGVLELGDDTMAEPLTPASLPLPAFGLDDEDEAPAPAPAEAAGSLRVDALGHPIGQAPRDADDYTPDMDDGEGVGDGYDNRIKTAADYGLPDWDDEPENEDVDDVVDPLAEDVSVSSSLMSLVSRGLRIKKSVDLTHAEPAPAIPQAYEGEPVAIPHASAPAWSGGDAQPYPADQDYPGETAHDDALDLDFVADEDEEGEPVLAASDLPFDEDAETPVSPVADAASVDADIVEAVAEPAPAAPVAFADPAEAGEPDEDFAPVDAESPEGLYDCLAAAREMAQTALTTEDRSRKALYTAVSRAYDFSLEAAANPGDFDEILVDNGLTFQDRAPMTPVVKLVFGADYDKTRLTEYAAVLMHAHRNGIERGTLANVLREAEGGLKAIVAAERRARREEQGKPVEDVRGVKANLAKKLRRMEPLALADLDEDGAEFALVMVRRTPEGDLVVLGEVPEDIALVERAARKLLG